MNLNQEKGKLPAGYLQKTIDNIKFTVQPFTAIEALRLKSVLFQKLIPSLGQILGGLGEIDKNKGIEDINLDGNSITNALDKLFSELTEEDFISLIKRFLTNTIAEAKVGDKNQAIQINSEDAINAVFQGKLFTIYKVIVLVLEANYPDFFALMGGIGGQLKTVLSGYVKENANGILNE